MKGEEAVVHGRLGPVKTEYSQDELPLDPEFDLLARLEARPATPATVAWCFRVTLPGSATMPRLSSRTGSGELMVPCGVPGVRSRAG